MSSQLFARGKPNEHGFPADMIAVMAENAAGDWRAMKREKRM
jgi:hypothetical protein